MEHLHHGQEMMMTQPSTTGHEAAFRAVQKPPSKPWRAVNGMAAPTLPTVYRVEPREFQELVQRLTGAPGAARLQPERAVVALIQPVPVRPGSEEVSAAAAPWCSFPFIPAPAGMQPGLGHELT